MSRTLRFLVPLVSIWLLAAIIGVGQTITTGSIDGTIKDPNGAVVPGASVTVTGVSTGFTQTVTTNSDGYFRIDRAPAGSYKLTVAAISGFAQQTAATSVNIDKTSTIDLALSTQVSNNVVVVGADPLGVSVDTSDSKVQTEITSELLQKLPTGTTLSSVLKISPATRQESLIGGFTVDGASKAENTFSIDGQDVTNFRHGTLNDNGTGVDNQNIPTALIKEVQVKTSGFEAENGGASGAVVVIATKSGTDSFHGEVGAQFQTSKWQPNNNSSASLNTLDYGNGVQNLFSLPGAPKDSWLEFDPTVSLGGPIIKRHLWFFGIYSPQNYNATRVVHYDTITPNGALIQDPNVGKPNYPAGPSETYQASTRYEYAEGRLDYSIKNNLNGFTSYLWNPYIQHGLFPYGAFAINAVEPRSVAYAQTGPDLYRLKGGRSPSEVFNTQMTWTPRSWFALTGRFGYGYLNSKPGNYASDPGGGLQYLCAGTNGTVANPTIAYQSGLAGCSLGFQSTTSPGGIVKDISKHKTTDVDASFFFNGWGRHDLKAGYEIARIGIDDLQSSTNYLSMRYGQASSHVPCSLITVTNPGGNCYGYGIAVLYGEGATGSNKAQALYVQDKWTKGRLTLNLGVRSESENLPSFSTLTANTNPIHIPWGRKTVPRLGAAYDLHGNGKTRIFGSFGIFSDRMKFEMPIGSFGGAIYYVDYFPIKTANYSTYNRGLLYGTYNPVTNGGNPSLSGGISTFHENFRPDSSTHGCDDTTFDEVDSTGSCSELGVSGITLSGVDPNMQPFKQREITAGFETELSRNYVLGVHYTRKDVLHTIEDTGVGEDSYYTIGNPGEGLTESQRLAMGYPATVKPQREFNGVEVDITKRFGHHYYYSANYTWSRLFGNYSGLANSDYFDSGSSLNGTSATRSDPGVNRFYDWSVAGYTAQGKPDNGLLATDRTHVVKAYGGYGFDWFGSKTSETFFSFFQTLESGTPQTTAVDVLNGAGMYLVYTKRGDLGRTPMFSQTDFNVSHTYKFGRDGRFKMVGDLTINNLWNQHVVTAINPRRWIQDGPDGSFIGGQADDVAFEKSLVAGQLSSLYTQLDCTSTAACNALGIFPNSSNGSNLNILYKQPSAYQAQRNIRFGFRFVF